MSVARAANDVPLNAHSLAEASLFLTATSCRACGKGPLRAGAPREVAGDVVILGAECVSCHGLSSWAFRIRPSSPGVINASADASEILDVAQWVMLSGMIAAAATVEVDKVRKRRLSIEAAQCLEEALKFYVDDNDLPPANAFFHEGSRLRFRQGPEHFSRQRLLHLRSKLPHVTVHENNG